MVYPPALVPIHRACILWNSSMGYPLVLVNTLYPVVPTSTRVQNSRNSMNIKPGILRTRTPPDTHQPDQSVLFFFSLSLATAFFLGAHAVCCTPLLGARAAYAVANPAKNIYFRGIHRKRELQQ